MKKNEVKAYLQQTKEKFKSLGYNIFLYPDSYYQWSHGIPTYGYIVKKDRSRFSYFQLEEPWHHAIRLTTYHKANKKCGTGFACQDHWDAIEIDKLTKEHIKELCEKHVEQSFQILPQWKPYQRDIQAAYREQYRDIREWLAYEKKHFPNIHQY